MRREDRKGTELPGTVFPGQVQRIFCHIRKKTVTALLKGVESVYEVFIHEYAHGQHFNR